MLDYIKHYPLIFLCLINAVLICVLFILFGEKSVFPIVVLFLNLMVATIIRAVGTDW